MEEVTEWMERYRVKEEIKDRRIKNAEVGQEEKQKV